MHSNANSIIPPIFCTLKPHAIAIFIVIMTLNWFLLNDESNLRENKLLV